MKSLVITAVLALVYVTGHASSVSNEYCEDAVMLGRRHYVKSIFSKIDIVNTHIVVDQYDSIIFGNRNTYTMYVWKIDEPHPIEVLGIEDIATDCAMDDEGKVFFTTIDALYQYHPTTTSASVYKRGVKAKEMTIAVNGTYYFRDSKYIYFMSPKDTAWSRFNIINCGTSFAINSKGDLYYTDQYDFHNYVLLNGYMEAIKILRIRKSTTSNMVIDKRDDILYICTDYGLYWLEPGSYHPQLIPGFNEVYSIGFDRHGNVFIAEKETFYKLTLLAADPCITTTNTEVTETSTEMTTEAYEEEVTPDEHVAPLKEANTSLVLRWWFWICSIGVITTCNISAFILYNKVKATRRNRQQLRSDKERNFDQNLISLKDEVGCQPTSSE